MTRPIRQVLVVASVAGSTLGLATMAGSQAPEPRPVAQAVRLPEEAAIRIDGLLDDEGWRAAIPIMEFRQQEPIEGAVPTEPTEIRIVYDEEAIYIGARMHDSDPSGILAHQLQRDAGLGTDDRFMWILDTFRDGRTGYFFETNPAALMGDGLIGGGGGINKSWDGVWEVRTRILEDGWSVEIRIPFSTLNFDPARETWGINFQRTIRRRNEEILWSGWRRGESLFRPAHAGEVVGLQDLSQGIGIEVRPFLASSRHQALAAGTGWEGNVKTGFDVTYSVTPSLRAAATVNTDFAEVEVDQRRVNLTRFPLRFPEQRDFFLEGSGVFSFNWADPFFSRRIGLVEGQEVPIRFGGRLGGQVGRYELGLYQVRTGEAAVDFGGVEEQVPSEDFTVGRVRRSLFEQSHIGAIYTRRASESDTTGWAAPDRHTVGIDADFYTSRAFGRYNAQIEGFVVYHTDPQAGGDLLADTRRARGVRINFPNDLVRFHHSFRDFGTDWDPAVGFVERRGFRRHQPTIGFAPRPSGWDLVRQLDWELAFEYLTDLDNRLLTRNLDFTVLDLNFESGDRLTFSGGRGFERLESPFTIHGEGEHAIRVPAGDYDAWTWSGGFQTAGRRMLSGAVDLRRGDFWSGEITEVVVESTVRPLRGVSFSADYERNEVRLAEGDFNTNLARLSASWNLNPRASFTGNIQYEDVTDVVGLFARIRWIVRPGSDVYVVWTHNWRSEAERLLNRRFETLSRGGAMKVNYSYRF
ncbi:MAG: hydrolase [Gemmatimonas sp.]|nr:hydrolase [Gemmatimonas sp.]